MKIAVCLFGLHPDECWKNYPKRVNVAHKYWDKHIFKCNPVDIFLHSFSINKKQNIINEFHPTKFIIEHQKKFTSNVVHPSPTFRQIQETSYNMNWGNIMYSMTYSIKQSVKLKENYEKENNFTYDLVLLSRMDVIWLQPTILTNINPNYFYAPIWGKNNIHSIKNDAINDYWIISNSKNINKYSLLYDTIDEFLYLKGAHKIAKKKIDTFTNEIKYIFNDIDNDIIHHDLQRYLYDRGII